MRDKKRRVYILIISLAIVVPLLMGASPQPFGLAPTQKIDLAQASVPTCLNRVNIPESELHWIYVPTSADELYSDFDLLWLAGNLISSKIVDASTCPADGIGSNGYANACGAALARSKVIEIQNSFNQAVLDAWVNVSVPPVLLKQMMVYESQFWPSQVAPFHYGLGHITPVGMVNALEWNPDLIRACGSFGGTCGANPASANLVLENMLNTCPTCPNGIDMDRATQSVNLLALAVMGYCNQTAQLVFNATGWRSNWVVDYPTIWKLTLMNYNAGSVCVFDTVAATFNDTKGAMSWSDILAHVSSDQCSRGAYYANQITAKAYNFPPE